MYSDTDEEIEKTEIAQNDDATDSDTKNPEDVKSIEDEFSKNNSGLQGDSFYKPGGSSSPISSANLRANGVFKKAAVYLAGPFAIILVIIILLILMGIYKVPNYAANIAAYRLARTAMTYSKTSANIDAQRVSIDVNAQKDPSFVKSFSDKYGGLKNGMLEKMGAVSPSAKYASMKAQGTINYNIKQVKNPVFGTKYVITDVIINGEKIPVNNTSRFNVFNYKGQQEFAAKIEANVNKALQGSTTIVRGSDVSKKLRADLGIKLWKWQDKGAEYKNKTNAEALRLQQQEDTKNLSPQKPTTTPKTTQLAEASQQVEEAVAACDTNPQCVDESLKSNKLPDKVSKSITSATTDGFLSTVAKYGSVAYAIATPLCMVYDGSVVNMGSEINNQQDSSIKAAYSLFSASDQQKSGNTSVEAVNALNHKLGNDSGTIVDQYASGQTPDTSIEKSPQSDITGEYNLLNSAFGSNPVVETVSSGLDGVCPVLTSPQAAVAGVLISLLIKAVLAPETAGGGTVAVAAGEEALKKVAVGAIETTIKDSFVKGFLRGLVFKEGKAVINTTYKSKFGGFMGKFAGNFTSIELTTLLARLYVIHSAGTVNDCGRSVGSSAVNCADQGADQLNNTLNQQMFYAAPMTNKDTVSSDKQAVALMDKTTAQDSVYNKYFAATKPGSLMNKMSFKFAHVSKAPLSRLISSINPISLIENMGLLSQKTYAADGSLNGHYGLVQWGWTPEEEELINTDSSYQMFENSLILQNSGKSQEISDTYNECFTGKMGDLLSSGKIKRTSTGDIVADDGLCSPKNLGPSNKQYGDLVFRWRLEQRYLNTIKHDEGIQNPTPDDVVGTNQCTNSNSSNKTYVQIGDSLSVGMQSANIAKTLSSAGWTPTIYAQTGAPISWGIQQITSHKDVISKAGVIVIELGTNDGNASDFASRLNNLYTSLRNINPNAKIYWVNYVSSTHASDFQSMSAKLATFAAANNINVINWASIGAPLVQQDTAYGVHPYKDYDKLAAFVSQAIQASPGCSTTSSTGWVWPINKESLDKWSSLKNNESVGSGLNQCWLHAHTKNDGTFGYHAAIDIDVTNKPVYAAKNGTVITKASDGYNTLIIDVGDGLYATYEHMGTISVSVGDKVTAGQQIGISGDVGSAGAPHLHFGISTSKDRFGTYADPWATVNPLDYLPNDYSPALLKDDDTGSCLTKDIINRTDFGFAIYKIKGVDSRYK